MDNDESNRRMELLREYRRLLKEVEDTAKDRHVLRMLKQILDLTGCVNFNRWLGFVQGYLWSRGLRTIDQMREDVRALNL